MTQQKSKGVSIRAAMGAMIASGFITSIAGLLPFGLAYTLPDGILRNVAFVVSGIVTVGFFLWFSRHAYRAELEQMEESKRLKSEDREWDGHET